MPLAYADGEVGGAPDPVPDVTEPVIDSIQEAVPPIKDRIEETVDPIKDPVGEVVNRVWEVVARGKDTPGEDLNDPREPIA